MKENKADLEYYYLLFEQHAITIDYVDSLDFYGYHELFAAYKAYGDEIRKRYEK